MMSQWECVIGLEVHVQLKTQSKIFSGAPTAFGAEPNTQACAVDLGLPGVLPVLNRDAVEKAITFGLAVGGDVARTCRFDRKNYFYPDLPKGYQISQLDEPIVAGGHLDVEFEGELRRINLTRAHLEEDAGKSVHDAFADQSGIDLNRAGTPLLEVVSEPELTSPAEAAAYFRTLHALVRYLGICDGNLNEGSMRCDANVSIRPPGSNELNERTEIKNINSFRFVERAITFEIERQIELVESGGKVVLETMLYDAERDETRPMRSKENSDDYRYFPDPDLLPVVVTDTMLEEARAALPELPAAKRKRYVEDLGLDAKTATRLVADLPTASYFEATAAAAGNAQLAANWITSDVAAALNKADDDTEIKIPAETLGTLIQRIEDDTISSKIARTLFDVLWAEGGDVDELIKDRGLEQVSDTGALKSIVDEIVAQNTAQVEQYRAGKTKVLGFFVGQVMKATQGKANPKQVNELLTAALAGE